MKTEEKKVGQQMRITEEEIAIIKATFFNNEPLLKILRKVFLPELDPSAPIGQNIDLWMTVNIDNMSPEQALIKLKARNILITHIDAQLMQLKMLSEIKEETLEQLETRLRRDSSK